MLNNGTTPPRSEDLDNETAVWDRLRADIDGGRPSRDVLLSAQRGEASDSAYLEYDDEELSAAMQASEHDAPGGSPREHEFSDLEERISEAEVPLDDDPLLELEAEQAPPPVVRRSQPPAISVSPEPLDVEEVHDDDPYEHAHDEVVEDVPEEAQTHERISYFERAQVEAYQQSPIAAFADEHAAALAKAHGQSRYEQAWAEWDRQFEGIGQTPALASAVEPSAVGKRSRLLVPGVALAALVGLGAAAYQLVIVPGQQEAEATAAPPAKAPAVEAQAAQGEAAQKAADEAIARADEAANAAQNTAKTDQANPTRAAEEPTARVAPATTTASDEESPEARRERIRKEKSDARREARHRRREEKRLAELADARTARENPSERVERASAKPSAAAVEQEEDDDAAGEGETVIKPEPLKSKKKGASSSKSEKKSGEDSDDPLYGID